VRRRRRIEPVPATLRPAVHGFEATMMSRPASLLGVGGPPAVAAPDGQRTAAPAGNLEVRRINDEAAVAATWERLAVESSPSWRRWG
jgi:hypothetical protein